MPYTPEDHLHISGEYDVQEYHDNLEQGLPPHTWRIRSWVRSSGSGVRITSTYVENTQSLIDNNLKSKDHLHIRGEYTKRSLIIEPFQFYEN